MRVTLYTDAGSRGNPGMSAIAWMIIDSKGDIVEKSYEYVGVGTNNEAEYKAVIVGLSAILALDSPVDTVTVVSDSKLVVNQLNGGWDVKNNRIRVLYDKVRCAQKKIGDVKYVWRPREHPEIAICDKYVNQCLDDEMDERANQK